MKFNSQICTTREQSERLIALGLKKETADMAYRAYGQREDGGVECATNASVSYGVFSKHDIPAWSLHRLIELTERCFYIGKTQDGYNEVVDTIDYLIKEGCFNKEYLEE